MALINDKQAEEIANMKTVLHKQTKENIELGQSFLDHAATVNGIIEQITNWIVNHG